MHKRTPIDVYEFLTPILKTLKKGALLTTKSGNEVNTMSIAWGQIGIEWNKLIFSAYVRTGRHSHKLLEENGAFTLNFEPKGGRGDVIKFCGTKSGRKHDKVKEMNLTLVDGEKVNVPAIAEFPLTLECKVIYQHTQDGNAIPETLKERFHPQDTDSNHPSSNRDFHTVYYGEIVSAYLLESE